VLPTLHGLACNVYAITWIKLKVDRVPGCAAQYRCVVMVCFTSELLTISLRMYSLCNSWVREDDLKWGGGGGGGTLAGAYEYVKFLG
jgi:hypothetical protein